MVAKNLRSSSQDGEETSVAKRKTETALVDNTSSGQSTKSQVAVDAKIVIQPCEVLVI